MGKKVKKKRVRKGILSHFLNMLGLASILAVIGGVLFLSGILKFQSPCANSISCINDLSGKFEPDSQAIFMGQKIPAPSRNIAEVPKKEQVLGESTGIKHISVDLSAQRLYAYEGDKKVFEFPVATGKWGPTPTGVFKIWIKLLYTRMSGGEGADYYNLPNVPYVMFFYNDQVGKGMGYSIHGAYWHNNFGYPMSHGCVNMRPEDAAKIYDWADPVSEGNVTPATADNPGTTITIYGTPPV